MLPYHPPVGSPFSSHAPHRHTRQPVKPQVMGKLGKMRGIRRRARNHARALERLGCKVTIEPVDPGAGELLPVTTIR